MLGRTGIIIFLTELAYPPKKKRNQGRNRDILFHHKEQNVNVSKFEEARHNCFSGWSEQIKIAHPSGLCRICSC